MSAPVEAIAQEIVWKNEELRRFCVTLVTRAIGGPAEFTTDLVSDESREQGAGSKQPGTGMAGSAATLLRQAHVIDPVGHFIGKDWYPKRALSTRPDAKGRYLAMYRLSSYALAAAFLRKHGIAPATPMQLALPVIKNDATMQRSNSETLSPSVPHGTIV